MFDSADGYSVGLAEEILGKAIAGKRNRLLISTKTTFPIGDGPNDYGSSRQHLIEAVRGAHCGAWAPTTSTCCNCMARTTTRRWKKRCARWTRLVRAGKVRYIGCSNFSGWHLMKSLAVSERYGWPRHVAHQAYYSLLNRDYEWELMPLARDQGVGAVIWSPLGWGKLTGKIRRGQPAQPARARTTSPAPGRSSTRSGCSASSMPWTRWPSETGKTITQIALELAAAAAHRVDSVIIGARNEQQLMQNIGAVGWALAPEHIALLDAASDVAPAYPVWHQRGFPMLHERMSLQR